jgi:hypothetical protein
MVLEAKTDAPELALDGSTQAGFCKWFMSLPQVGGCSSWGAHIPCCTQQHTH